MFPGELITHTSDFLPLRDYRHFRATCRHVRAALNKVHMCRRFFPFLLNILREAGGDDFATALIAFRVDRGRHDWHLRSAHTEGADTEGVDTNATGTSSWTFSDWLIESVDRRDLEMTVWCLDSLRLVMGPSQYISTSSPLFAQDCLLQVIEKAAVDGWTVGLRLVLVGVMELWLSDPFGAWSSARADFLADVVGKATQAGEMRSVTLILDFLFDRMGTGDRGSAAFTRMVQRMTAGLNEASSHEVRLACLDVVQSHRAGPLVVVSTTTNSTEGFPLDLFLPGDDPTLCTEMCERLFHEPDSDGPVMVEFYFSVASFAAENGYHRVASEITRRMSRTGTCSLHPNEDGGPLAKALVAVEGDVSANGGTRDILSLFLSNGLFTPRQWRSATDYSVNFCLKDGRPPLLRALREVISIKGPDASSAICRLDEKYTFLHVDHYPVEIPAILSILLEHGWRPWRNVVLRCLYRGNQVPAVVKAFVKSGVSLDCDVEREGSDAVPLLEDLLVHYKHGSGAAYIREQDAVVRCLLQAGAAVNRKVLTLSRARGLPCVGLVEKALQAK